MALPVGEPHDRVTLTNPSSALTDFTLLIDTSNLSSQWRSSKTSNDGARGRAFKADGTELATDWIPIDAANGEWAVRVLWSGTLASTGTQQVYIYPPLSTRSAYAAGDTYGRNAAYTQTNRISAHSLFSTSDLTDRSGNGYDVTEQGTIVGTVTAPVGTAIDLAGLANYLKASSYATMASGDVTAMAFVGRLFSAEIATTKFADTAMSWYDAADRDGFRIGLNNDGVNSGEPIAFTTGGNTQSESVAQGTDAKDGAWHRIACVFDQTANEVNLYLDGSLDVAATSYTDNSAVSTTPVLLIGRTDEITVPASQNRWEGDLQFADVWRDGFSAAWWAYDSDQHLDNATFVGTPTHVPTGTPGMIGGGLHKPGTIG